MVRYPTFVTAQVERQTVTGPRALLFVSAFSTTASNVTWQPGAKSRRQAPHVNQKQYSIGRNSPNANSAPRSRTTDGTHQASQRPRALPARSCELPLHG